MAVLAVCLVSGCTTLANRRDMYFPQRVDGPYTQMLRKGVPKPVETEGAVVPGDFKAVR